MWPGGEGAGPVTERMRAGPGGDAPDGPAQPGTGWPGDPATAATPVARDAAGVRDLAAGAGTVAELVARQSVCHACPRLVEWRGQGAAVQPAAPRRGRDWGRPLPRGGAGRAGGVVLGPAPGAPGGAPARPGLPPGRRRRG